MKTLTIILMTVLSSQTSTAGGNEREQSKSAEVESVIHDVDSDRFLHGFRLGYLYVSRIHQAADGVEGHETLAEVYGIRSPHQFLLGYEVTWRMVGHSWLNMLLVGNIMIAGIEQSRFLPSGNGILGFELNNSFQVGGWGESDADSVQAGSYAPCGRMDAPGWDVLPAPSTRSSSPTSTVSIERARPSG